MEETKNPVRKPVRLKEYGYGAGVYFVTIVAKDRQKIFSTITGSRQNVGAGYIRPEDVQNELTVIGNIAEQRLLEIPVHYPGVQIENYVIMPNHIHIIFGIEEPPTGRIYPAPTEEKENPATRKLCDVIGKYKAAVSRVVGHPIWQRSYYDHVIRSQQDYEEIWQYIDNNPLQWLLDKE